MIIRQGIVDLSFGRRCMVCLVVWRPAWSSFNRSNRLRKKRSADAEYRVSGPRAGAAKKDQNL
jgi:hypothetical protein